MRVSISLSCVLILAVAGISSCRSGEPAVPVSTPPTPTEPNGETPVVIPATGPIFSSTVGNPIQIDASVNGAAFAGRLDGTLTYQVVFTSDANGLSATNAVITGVPTRPTIVTATLTASNGSQTASLPVRIVAFAAGLTKPNLPSTLLGYSEARAPLPTHLTIVPGVANPDTSAEAKASRANPITDAGATLGRVLFHDRRISANDAVSCESCHHQSTGFGDTARFSKGFAGGLTRRHAMALANLRFRAGVGNGFFWDQRAPTLEQQVLMPMQDPIEMGNTLANVVTKVTAAGFYQPLFAAAFGTSEINEDRIARALAQYLRSLVSTQSAFDKAFEPGALTPNVNRMTAQVRQGHELFFNAGCTACHFNAAQMMAEAANSGLDEQSVNAGAGGARFRPPSLRNVALHPPFMHDGRFRTLEEVVDFYDSQVHDNPNLDPRMMLAGLGGVRRLRLEPDQRAALVEFLKSLTDAPLIADPRFSDPFAVPK